METLIRAGGLFNIALVLFHLSFWRVFHWREDLQNLDSLNRAIMQVLNISLMVVFAIFGYISLAHSRELLDSPLGHSLLVLMALFWLARAVQQVIFFGLRHPVSWLFLTVFMTGSVLYAIPAISIP